MNQTYDTAYQSAVEAMIAEGMDVFLLNGRAVRERQALVATTKQTTADQPKHRTVPTMGETMVQSLSARCHGTLAVSAASAEQLVKTAMSRAKARSAV